MTEDDDFQLETFLPYLLNRAAEATSLEFQRLYKDRYGMLRTEWRVLYHLGRYETLTAKAICDRAGLHKTKVSRAVAALEKRRFVARDTVAEDRRKERLRLTPAGQAAFRDLTAEARRYNARLLANFSSADRKALNRLLTSLAGDVG